MSPHWGLPSHNLSTIHHGKSFGTSNCPVQLSLKAHHIHIMVNLPTSHKQQEYLSVDQFPPLGILQVAGISNDGSILPTSQTFHKWQEYLTAD